jgi:hypothetical protein
MDLTQNLAGADNYVLQSAITAYADEAYTNARKLSGTGIAGTDARIDPSTETFIGQMRWFKPLNPVINVASLTDPTKGTPTTYSSEYSTYIKSVRTHGAEKVNLQHVVTQDDGLAKIGRDFAETRAQDEHNAMLAVMKGVAISELLYGAGSASGVAGLGGQNFDNDPTDKRYGFYVDLGANSLVGAASASSQGAQRAEQFLNAMGMAWKDYEPEYAYLITSPQMMAMLRSANLVDQTKVSEANITFETIFGGKLRLIQTRATQGLSAAQLTAINTGAGVDIVGTKTSFIVLPGAIAMPGLNIEVPTEITRDGASYQGGGSTNIWHRWGYVAHPAGYNWKGKDDRFAADADYMKIVKAAAQIDLSGATVDNTTVGTWERKTNSALGLSILPVFHS